MRRAMGWVSGWRRARRNRKSAKLCADPRLNAQVADTGGRRAARVFIRTVLRMAGSERRIEINLVDRGRCVSACCSVAPRWKACSRSIPHPFLQPASAAAPEGTWMKIAILSRNTRLYSTRRLVEAARERDHSVRVLDPLRCYMRIAPDGFAIHYKGRRCADYDGVIPRIGASITFYGTAVLRQFEMMGVYTPNASDAIAARARQAALPAAAGRAGHRPADHRVRRQPRRHRRSAGDARRSAARHQAQRRRAGQGVMLAEKRAASQSVIEAFRGCTRTSSCRSSSREAKGSDLRCFVVGGKVVAAMRGRRPTAISAPTCTAAAARSGR